MSAESGGTGTVPGVPVPVQQTLTDTLQPSTHPAVTGLNVNRNVIPDAEPPAAVRAAAAAAPKADTPTAAPALWRKYWWVLLVLVALAMLAYAYNQHKDK